MNMNKPFTGKKFVVYLDGDGMVTLDPEKAVTKPIIVRYQQDEPWCIKHNCRLAQCAEQH